MLEISKVARKGKKLDSKIERSIR